MNPMRIICCMALLCSAALWAGENGPTLEERHPGLASGALRLARLGALPEGVLLRSGELVITRSDLDGMKGSLPPHMASQWQQAAFLMLENRVTTDLLLAQAKAAGHTGEKETVIDAYFRSQIADITASDEEVARFHRENPDVATAPLEQMASAIKAYLIQAKQQDRIQEIVADLGKERPIVVDATWAAEQARIASDNPVDQARQAGKPAMVFFGADGCRPCDMMRPFRENLQRDFAEVATIAYVHVHQQPLLAARYGIQTIPVIVLFDETGKEVWRNVGFVEQSVMEQQLATVGVKR